ncbi:3-methyl-2-oxobutanoate hydroxymethyltransferase [Carboxydothermus hydrogenoformans]|uniref:3-methyl-2-oxobutanoate hydroxymethyltransferase n=1 Tax=Carboxydothermus hydrogenoformans (strain ATCC BAA-161 / DSM 6008 / Z-2901) TaxID=246194 RepID=PANB_CARHZ|nr:3-methyl-2-oxobutanoate hydroxymethyltransferase [Carboxydothermus hydrogenoformans]Q3A9L0.1 RecName: Full=3-methyl-2-oxobutanoate hydroxymethyltransferase; AltName: Full=Ketopantoate hydroxymethyltransferase; Short=KPHMT [Carboxydothermus hydrogenoformans Z-2901]ABB15151.1 3-methyl-2-oxobutanoate hydroxymethyltransferase [Carboxydothermus hydrogenoformans Z-2901]
MDRVTVSSLKEMKEAGQKIAMITAYDYPSALFAEEAGAEVLLVGDSLGMVVLGYDSTVPVTMEEMLHHVKAVVRGSKRSMVVADMPFMSYQASYTDALYNAGRFLKEGGAQAVKLEGGGEIAELVAKLVTAGIPVMGHIGLTPQSVNALGGYKVQGKDLKTAQKLLDDAKALADAGAFAIVLECVPAALAAKITESIPIPTIGIGSGVNCDGQVLVYHDVLGMYPRMLPKFVKRYADLSSLIKEAIRQYVQEVKEQQFPEEKHSFTMAPEILERIY